jgi:hypothetical protein
VGAAAAGTAGAWDGAALGTVLGAELGVAFGWVLGLTLGLALGLTLGALLGLALGAVLGAVLGAALLGGGGGRCGALVLTVLVAMVGDAVASERVLQPRPYRHHRLIPFKCRCCCNDSKLLRLLVATVLWVVVVMPIVAW